MTRARSALAAAAAAALLLGVTAPAAVAQTTTTSAAAEASSAGLSLTIAGSDAVTVAETTAVAVPGAAAALGVPLSLGGTPIGDLAAESDGATVADDGCVTPEVPAPLDSLLDGGLACASVSATGDDGAATATAGVAEVGLLTLDGADLGPLNDLLATLPLDDLLAALDDGLDTVLGDASLLTEVRDGCISVLEAAEDGGGLIGGLLDQLTDAIGDLTGTLDLQEISDVVDGLGDVLDELSAADALLCETLGDLADTLLAGDLVGTLTSGDLLAALATTDGVLNVTLLETTSTVDREDDTVTAVAGPGDGAITLTLDLPLLDELLGDLLEGAVDAAVAPLLANLDTVLDTLDGAVSEVPLLGEIISPLLTIGDVGALLDGPLLDVGVAPGESSATGDLGDLSTDGTSSPALVTLGGSLLALPVLDGLDDALNTTAGLLDSELLSVLADSPLADVVAVSLLDGDVTDATVRGLPGTEATSGTATVTLLAVLDDPLVDLQLAPASAAVGVGAVTTTDDDPDPIQAAGPDPDPLPVTGAGAALFGLLALGAAGMLRRRG